jgi:hypothetical protein
LSDAATATAPKYEFPPELVRRAISDLVDVVSITGRRVLLGMVERLDWNTWRSNDPKRVDPEQADRGVRRSALARSALYSSRRSVSYGLRELEAAQLLTVKRRKGFSSWYTLDVRLLMALAAGRRETTASTAPASTTTAPASTTTAPASTTTAPASTVSSSPELEAVRARLAAADLLVGRVCPAWAALACRSRSRDLAVLCVLAAVEMYGERDALDVAQSLSGRLGRLWLELGQPDMITFGGQLVKVITYLRDHPGPRQELHRVLRKTRWDEVSIKAITAWGSPSPGVAPTGPQPKASAAQSPSAPSAVDLWASLASLSFGAFLKTLRPSVATLEAAPALLDDLTRAEAAGPGWRREELVRGVLRYVAQLGALPEAPPGTGPPTG